jgi:hypothetical protein
MAKITEKLSPIENAQKTLNELEAKRGAVAASGQNDERELEAVAFAAHTGDQKAAAKLETLKERALRRDLELKSVDAASPYRLNSNVTRARHAKSYRRSAKLGGLGYPGVSNLQELRKRIRQFSPALTVVLVRQRPSRTLSRRTSPRQSSIPSPFSSVTTRRLTSMIRARLSSSSRSKAGRAGHRPQRWSNSSAL